MEAHTEVKNSTALEVVCYTDPLCCWSWAFEPVLRQLKEEYHVSIRYCMGGMLSSWKHYHDALQAVSRPLQMGPVWMQARQMTGAVIDDKIWFRDPPASSYPACVAVKTAGLQSPEMEEKYLYLLWEAVMVKGKNIAKKEVLLDLAAALETGLPGSFSADSFDIQLGCKATVDAFRSDLQEVSYRRIERFPSLLLTARRTGQALLLTGNRPIDEVMKGMEKVLNS
ncbi:DsbA family protein [Chitinophaga sancti]|uniref:DsbA family protein n=1 Tax=Chitinophaga sancti TaxID=1004 RepID=A0A1K1RZ82_9BACT|nr:DsbA family protein [Chitinophaga sancti]WQD64115.1 DsbA family protein [Chitinophaga sancti]WQG90261.1 DsbA family protein [Chitinophaga sancti]SFW77116.1 protein-disulfide isomerase, contains CxxC motif [Chitinophaga sancti]